MGPNPSALPASLCSSEVQMKLYLQNPLERGATLQTQGENKNGIAIINLISF